MKPGKELDHFIATELLRLSPCDDCPRFSTFKPHSILLLEFFNADVTDVSYFHSGCSVVVKIGHDLGVYSGECLSVEHAICMAVIKARKAEAGLTAALGLLYSEAHLEHWNTRASG